LIIATDAPLIPLIRLLITPLSWLIFFIFIYWLIADARLIILLIEVFLHLYIAMSCISSLSPMPAEAFRLQPPATATPHYRH
jgi:hypothetical protein